MPIRASIWRPKRKSVWDSRVAHPLLEVPSTRPLQQAIASRWKWLTFFNVARFRDMAATRRPACEIALAIDLIRRFLSGIRSAAGLAPWLSIGRTEMTPDAVARSLPRDQTAQEKSLPSHGFDLSPREFDVVVRGSDAGRRSSNVREAWFKSFRTGIFR